MKEDQGFFTVRGYVPNEEYTSFAVEKRTNENKYEAQGRICKGEGPLKETT